MMPQQNRRTNDIAKKTRKKYKISDKIGKPLKKNNLIQKSLAMKKSESYVVTQGIPRSKMHTSSRDDIELRLNWAVILNVCMSLVRTIYRIYTACAYIYIYIHIFIHGKYIYIS